MNHRSGLKGIPRDSGSSRNALKAELRRRGVTYSQLAELLSELGVQENERNLNNKISRGGFSASFLLLCLEAVGAKSVEVV